MLVSLHIYIKGSRKSSQKSIYLPKPSFVYRGNNGHLGIKDVTFRETILSMTNEKVLWMDENEKNLKLQDDNGIIYFKKLLIIV